MKKGYSDGKMYWFECRLNLDKEQASKCGNKRNTKIILENIKSIKKGAI